MRRLLALLCILVALNFPTEAQIPRVDVPGSRTSTGTGTLPDIAVESSKWIQGASGGNALKAQPSFTDLLGTASNAQIPGTLSGKRVVPRIVALTDAATVTPNIDTTDLGVLATLSQTTNFAVPSGTPDDGQIFRVRITSSTSRTLTFSSSSGGYSAGTNVALPTATTGGGVQDNLVFEWSAATSRFVIIGSTIAPASIPGTIQLAPQAAKLPSSSAAALDGSENNYRLLFDAASSECAIWIFSMPADYLSAPVFKAKYSMTSATSGSFNLDVSVMAVTPGDSADVNTDSYDTANNCDDGTVPGTAGFLDEISCTLTNLDSVAANDLVRLKVCRDIGDTATGDAELIYATLQYTR